MKKLFPVILLALVLTAVLSVSAAPEFYLSDVETVARFAAGLNNAEQDVSVSTTLTFSPTSTDPTLTIKFASDEQFSAEEYHFVAMKMSTKTSSTVGGFFYGTDKFPGPAGPEFTQYSLADVEGAMCDYIVDMSQNNHGRWSGTVNTFRIDAINDKPQNDSVITIDRIGFFKTYAEAEAFLAKEVEKVESTVTETKTAEPIYWDFVNDSTAADDWASSGGSCGSEFGFFKVAANTTDVYITTSLTEEEQFDATKLRYMAYRYMARDVKSSAAFFYSNGGGFSDAAYSTFGISGDGEWHNVLLDMGYVDPKAWTGTIKALRLDVSNPSTASSVVYISKLGFFSTRQEANDFLADSNEVFDYSTAATFTGSMQRVTVPAGTLYEGFKESDFILASTEIDADDASNYVVSYTDADGNESVVALSDVNSKGYAKYVARKPGTYKLTTNHKEYTDTDGHWGSEYIDYVSDRKLFGGTSETEFSPDMTMTRGMFITVLGRMHGVDSASYSNDTGYADVNSAEYYAPYISWAKENALMASVSDTAFAPEEPILRKDMALVIYNYINAFDYSFDSIATAIDFTDLASCTAEQTAAIKHIQACGIINGIGDNKFDPDGSSTRAEVATVMQRVIKSVLGAYLYSPYDTEYFKRDRIRIGSWGNPDAAYFDDDYARLLYEGGFDWLPLFSGTLAGDKSNYINTLNLCAKYGIEVYLADGAATADNPLEFNAEYYDHPAYTGSYVADEPGSDSFERLGNLAKNFTEATNGEKKPYINLLPMYANAAQLKYGQTAAAIAYYDSDPDLYRKHCQAFVDNVDVDYISTDIYPMRESIYNDYIESINIIAAVARENDKTFWCYFHGSNDNMPTKEFSWQAYSLLSFGCKGLLYWILEPNAFNNGQPTSNYEAAKPVLLEMRAISDVYVQYKNLGAFNHNYSTQYLYLRMTNPYTDFATISEIDTDAPLLVGCFEKKEGTGTAFTLVNMYNPRSIKEADVKLRINGTTVTSYYGGTPTVLTPDSDGYYNIHLGNGEGLFVTVD